MVSELEWSDIAFVNGHCYGDADADARLNDPNYMLYTLEDEKFSGALLTLHRLAFFCFGEDVDDVVRGYFVQNDDQQRQAYLEFQICLVAGNLIESLRDIELKIDRAERVGFFDEENQNEEIRRIFATASQEDVEGLKCALLLYGRFLEITDRLAGCFDLGFIPSQTPRGVDAQENPPLEPSGNVISLDSYR